MQPGSGAVTSVSGGYRGDPAVKMVQSDFMQGAMAASNGGHMLSHAHQWVTLTATCGCRGRRRRCLRLKPAPIGPPAQLAWPGAHSNKT